MSNSPHAAPPPSSSGWRQLHQSEDWWAIWIGVALLLICLGTVLVAGAGGDGAYASPLAGWLSKPGSWSANPIAAFLVSGETNIVPGLIGVFLLALIAFGGGTTLMGGKFRAFAGGFWFVFVLGTFAYVLAGQAVVKYYNLGYPLWALAAGLLISNTIGTPDWVRPAIRTEFFIKTGLVLLGAEILFSRLLTLGFPGHFRCLGRHAHRAGHNVLVRAEDLENRVAVAQHGHLGRHVGLWGFGGDRDGGGVQSQKGRIVAGDWNVANVHRRS